MLGMKHCSWEECGQEERRQLSGVPGVTAEKPQTVLIHYYRGYLNIIEVVGFLFRYRQFLFQCVA